MEKCRDSVKSGDTNGYHSALMRFSFTI